MEHVQLTHDGPIAILTLARGKANALNAAMVEELHAAVAQVAADGSRAVLLESNRPKFFSSGLDVQEVFAYDRPTLSEFFGRFMELYETITRIPKPVVAALSGHAYAGGAILALACDFRLMADGPFGFALNEVNLGVALPAGVIRQTLAAVGSVAARELLLLGESISPAKALAIGLVRELASPETVRERSLALARQLADKPPAAFAAIKSGLHYSLTMHGPGLDRLGLDEFADLWFSPECTARRNELIAKLTKP